MQERVTFLFGERFEYIRQWLEEYIGKPELPLDVFISYLFGEVLSQPGYALENDYDSALLVSQLIDSIRRFRLDISFVANQETSRMNMDYINFLENGIIAAQYKPKWFDQPDHCILLSPAYTFIMMNTPVLFQFWLDIGNMGWWERLDQPLTHPYVLNRNWNQTAKWTDAHEYEQNQKSMSRLVSGLIHRCKEHIYICTTSTNEQGIENYGPLLKTLQKILKHSDIKVESNDI